MAAARNSLQGEETPRDAEGWHRRGLEMRRRGQHGEAALAFAKAASLERGTARYHHELGVSLADDGKPDQAISAFRRALRIDESFADAHNDLGTAYYEKRWHAEAEASFRRATEIRPDHAVAWENLGAALRAQSKLREGRQAFQRALWLKVRSALPAFLRWRVSAGAPGDSIPGTPELKAATRAISEALLARRFDQALQIANESLGKFPGEADILFLVALVHEERFDTGQALSRIDEAIARKPDRTEFHVLRSRLLYALGNEASALDAAQRAVQLEPGSADAHAALAVSARAFDRVLAETSARTAVELDAGSHFAHNSLAAVLWPLGQLAEAIAHAREAQRLAPRAPLYLLNLAVILMDAGEREEASRIYRQLGANPPRSANALLNLGTLALACEGDRTAARRWYAQCQALGPDDRAALSESMIDLLENRFAEGWAKYEARKRVHGHRERHAPFAHIPEWRGEPGTQRLLVYGEQGIGDELMLAAMLRDLAKRAADIEFACDPRLAPLFTRSFPAVDITPTKKDAPTPLRAAASLAVALGSLGQYFRRDPSDFPEHRGYLIADREKSATWRARLTALGKGRKVGLSWRGGMPSTGQARRSLGLQQLSAVLDSPGIQWVSLQYGDVESETRRFEGKIHFFPGVADDMDELAALVDALDLVVSVCNATVHIAGAIGKEVLVMAPFLPEWRYGLRGERMLWYPSARVYRQYAMGDWTSVLNAVKAQLQT